MKDSKQGAFSAPEVYAECSRPRPIEAVKASLDAFNDELYALRRKHGIADVGVVALVFVEGANHPIATVGHIGDSANALSCAFTAVRHWREDRACVEAALMAPRNTASSAGVVGEDEGAADGE